MTESDKLRTTLANERTVLAYVRTALSAWIFGMAAIKFFWENFFIVSVGWGVAVGGLVILLWGLYQTRKRHHMIYQNKIQTESIEKPILTT